MYMRGDINKRMQTQNVERLNAEISNYFITKRKQDRHARANKKRRETLDKIEAQIQSEMINEMADIPTGKPVRAVSQLIEDELFTIEGLLKRKTSKGYDKRIRGLVEILRSIPEREYYRLKQIFQDGKVLIQIPDRELAGCVLRVAKYTHCTLYLSPMLEEHSYSYVKGIIGHELAHLLLHSDFSMKKRTSIAEAEATLKSKEWGF